MDNIVVAFANEEAQRRIVRLLESGGVSPAGCFFSGADAIRTIRQLGGGIVVCSFKLRDMTAVDLAASLRDLGTLLVVSSAANLDFCEGENLFKLATPRCAVRLFCLVGPAAPAGIPQPSPAPSGGGGTASDPPGQGAFDGHQPHDRGGSTPLFAKAQHGYRHPAGGNRPAHH